MDDITFDLSALDAAVREFAARAPGAFRDAAAQALYEEAEAIMAVSKAEFVPVDEGVLRGSGHVELPDMSGEQITVTMGYGGPAEAYALVQHENLSYHHRVGGPKYLERPLLEAVGGMDERLSTRIGELVG